MTIPAPMLLVGLALVAIAVIVLWKLLLTAAGIGLGLWLLVHATADSPDIQFLVFAVAGLAVAAALRHLSTPHNRALTGSANRKEMAR